MASENRVTPATNVTREAALDKGFAKNNAMGISSFITPSTVVLLNAAQPAYILAMDAVSNVKAAFNNATITKDADAVTCEMVSSHFIQVFYLAVKRGTFPAGDLAYYGVNESGNLPDMSTDAKKLSVATKIISGDAARVAAGGDPMAMPAIDEVQKAKDAFEKSVTNQNNCNEAMRTAQHDCNALNQQADECIKLLWGEVETHYVNLPRPSMREQARLWGVIYAQTGSSKIVTGKVTDKATSIGIADAEVYFANGSNSVTTDASGNYSLTTTLMGVQNLIAIYTLYTNASVSVTLVENQNTVADIVMDKAV